MADIDAVLKAALQQAQKKTPMNFAFVGKGANQGQLVVSKKPPASKAVAEARKKLGGGTVLRGRCIGEEGKLVFEVAKEPPLTLGKQLKTIIKENAGLILNVETRVAPDLVEEPEGEPTAPENQGEVAQTGQAPVGQAWAPATPSQGPGAESGTDAKADVTKRLAALAGPFKEAVGQKGPDVEKMQTLMATLKTHVAKREFDEAVKTLDELEPLVAKFKTQQADYKVRKGEVEATVTKIEGRGKDASKFKTALQDADKLEKTNVGEALAKLDKAKSEAEADIKVAEAAYQKVVTKQTETNKKIAALEKLPHAAHIASQIAVSKQKVTNAMKLADPPGHDLAGAISALVGVDAACVDIEKMTLEYQKVRLHKIDTDKKIARLENHPKKNFITAEIADVKAKETAALALAEPPSQKYVAAINALNAVDKLCAAAEVKILDEAVRGKDRGDMHDVMEKTFKERFGIELKMKDKGESPTEAYAAMRRVYELMALVPESHATRNPSLKKVERVGGAQQVSYYESQTDIFLGLGTKDSKKVVLRCDRPGALVTKGLQFGLTNAATGAVDPPVEPDCQPKTGANPKPDYFDWTTLHEIGHAIDDKKGFMKANYGHAGWAEHGASCAAAAQAVADHFNFKTKEALEYIRDMLEGKPGKRPSDKPPAPSGRPDWNTVRVNVENYCDSIRVNKDPWEHLPVSIGDRVYHEAYEKNWVSYLRAKRSQAITGYQFRAPGEWFSELYAAYQMGVLKDSHPMVKIFLRDL